MKKIIFLSFFSVNIILVFAQTKGLVVDSDNTPIDNVSVYFTDQKVLLNTNEDGTFLLDQEIPDNSTLYLYKLGYSSKLVKYQQNIPFRVILEKLHITLDEIGVVESFNELDYRRIDKEEIQSAFFILINPIFVFINIF